MISTRADYKFVTGAINTVIIDGGIMPLRQRPEILRGEDLCWCWERIGEIEAACNTISSDPRAVDNDFVKRWTSSAVAGWQWRDIVDATARIFSGSSRKMYGTVKMAKGIPTNPVAAVGDHAGMAFARAYSALIYNSADFTSPFPQIMSGTKLLMQPVAQMISILNSVNLVLRSSQEVRVDGTKPSSYIELVINYDRQTGARGHRTYYKNSLTLIPDAFAWVQGVALYVFEPIVQVASYADRQTICCLSSTPTISTAAVADAADAVFGSTGWGTITASLNPFGECICRLTDHTHFDTAVANQ